MVSAMNFVISSVSLLLIFVYFVSFLLLINTEIFNLSYDLPFLIRSTIVMVKLMNSNEYLGAMP